MPGRGQPWKGVGKGNPDRIGSGAIADGSITEADLDSSVTLKLNATGHSIEDEGSPLTDRPDLNFVGAGVTATDDGEKTVVTIPGGGGGGGLPDPVTDFEFYDEFIYNVAPTVEHWEQLAGSGVWDLTISSIGGVSGRQTTGEGASGGGIRLNQNSLADVAKDFVLRWRTRSVNVSLLANRQGFYPANFSTTFVFPFATEPTPRLVFAHDGTEVDTNWRAETHDGSTLNTTDTGVAVDTSFHVFEINRSGSTITFLIDGASVATYTTNLPTGNLQMFYYSQDGESVPKVQEFDTAQLQSTR